MASSGGLVCSAELAGLDLGASELAGEVAPGEAASVLPESGETVAPGVVLVAPTVDDGLPPGVAELVAPAGRSFISSRWSSPLLLPLWA